jgi:hypothetical protein
MLSAKDDHDERLGAGLRHGSYVQTTQSITGDVTGH